VREEVLARCPPITKTCSGHAPGGITIVRSLRGVTVIGGARVGKDSRIAAPVVCYEALLGGHERHLAKGERGVIALVAQDARATRVAFCYVKDYLTDTPCWEARWRR
jgi:hypothetical protein